MALPIPNLRPAGAASTPGALMFIGGLALVYWALSGWGLFGLGKQESSNSTASSASTPRKPAPGFGGGRSEGGGGGGSSF